MLYPLCRTHVCNTHTSAYIQLEHIYTTHTQMLRCHVYHHGAHTSFAHVQILEYMLHKIQMWMLFTQLESLDMWSLLRLPGSTLHMLMYTSLNAWVLQLHMAVNNHWTGLLERTIGLTFLHFLMTYNTISLPIKLQDQSVIVSSISLDTTTHN